MSSEKPPIRFAQFKVAFLFLFGTIPLTLYFGWLDLNYWSWGEVAQAEIVDINEVGETVYVSYKLNDPELGPRTEEDTANAELKKDPDALVVGKKVTVEFIPGAYQWSRLKSSWSGFLIMGGFVLVVFLFIGTLLLFKRTFDSDSTQHVKRY